MSLPLVLLSASAIFSLLALALSFGSQQLSRSRRCGHLALWLALAALPASLAADAIHGAWATPSGGSTTTWIGPAIAHLKSYGALVMPFAVLAMLAVRRANVARSRR